ncbi:hypothetical protein C8F04DRAFT_1393994 [Mycena alexandri]|uniref:Uncharacterized protein n=1 Tax=Mycena alexandri TaxID=1745969 RepID=A0AAD6X6G3_9AGAR|nr:hypothetical protein C8F04DRAFT_1393994 [Mycena alexandri]
MLWTFLSLFWVLFLVLTVYSPLAAGQANRTLDDFSSQIVYTPAADVTHLVTTGFDVTKLYNGTIGIMNASSTETVNMTMQFTGTAVWLFLAKPPTTDTFSTAFTIFLDGVDVNDDAEIAVPGDAEYTDLAYSNTSLRLGQHSVVLSTSGTVYFDYGVFTSNNPDPETSVPPVQPSSSSASSSKSKITGHPPSGSQSAVPQKSTSHVAVIAGAAVGVVLLLGGGVALFLLCRRRQTRPILIKSPSTYVHQEGNSIPYSGEAVYRSHPAVHTSEAALLRVPVTSSVSGYTPSPSLAMIAQPPAPPDSEPPYQLQPQSQGSPQLQFEHRPQHYHHQDEYPPQQYHPPSQFENPLRSPYQPHSPYALPAEPPHGQFHQQSPVQRMLAEQRAIEAEYARPTAWIADQKAPIDVDIRPQGTSVGHHLAPSPDTRSISSSRSASSPVYPPSPNMSGSANIHGHGDPLLSNMAAEMVALRAQVARLEGERGGGVELPPPAYD